MPNSPDIAARKAQLETRLADLTARMERIDGELDAPHTQDWDDLATEREADEVLEHMGLSAQAEVRQIQAALQRVEEGTYGTCVKCGGEIAAERLDVLPYTPFCSACAS